MLSLYSLNAIDPFPSSGGGHKLIDIVHSFGHCEYSMDWSITKVKPSKENTENFINFWKRDIFLVGLQTISKIEAYNCQKLIIVQACLRKI